MESGYIEDEMDFFIVNTQKMMQAELERYFSCIKLVRDYYSYLQGKGPHESQLRSNFEVLPPPEVSKFE